LHDLKVLAHINDYASTYRQAFDLANKALLRLDEFNDAKIYEDFELILHINAASRLLRAKFTELKSAKGEEELKELFMIHHRTAVEICLYDEERFAPHLTVLMFRLSVFLDKIEEVNGMLSLDNGEQNLDLLRILREEMEEYEYLAKNATGLL